MIGTVEKKNTDKINQKDLGIKYHFLDGKKFKTNLIGVLIRTRLTRKDATKTALLAEVLKSGCEKYPSRQDISIQTEEMNGSIFDVSIIKKGEEQILFFYLETIKGDFNQLAEGIDFLNNIITKPLLEYGGFQSDIVRRQKKSLKRMIQMRSDDKKEYAKLRCLEEMCAEEPFGIYADGYEKDICKIDGRSLYTHYCKLLESAPIEIIFSGDVYDQQYYETAKSGFHFPKRDFKQIQENKIVTKVHELKEFVEQRQVLQGKLCIGFRSSLEPVGKDFYSLLVYNEIVGAGPSSRLFAQVREKESLCYYVNSILYRYKSIIMVQSGIEAAQFHKTADMIQTVIEELKQNLVTAEELRNAKSSLLKHYQSLYDNQTGMMDFYMNEYILNTGQTLQEFMESIEKITIEDIKNTAKTIYADTVYFLCPEGGNENGSNGKGQ